ncbi:hypothetical protein vBKpnAMK5_00291 [Klebsiella phage vB_Kpn_AM_K5]
MHYRGTEEAVDISDKTIDLNSLVIKRTDPGTRQLYKCVSSGGGNNISNKPTSDGNFVLEVLSLRKVSNTDWSCKQTFTTKKGGVEGTYIRYAQNGSWSAWKEVVAGVQPINLGGTGATSVASARNNLGVGEGQTVSFGNLVTNDLTANGNARLVGRLNLGSTSATGVLRANETGAVVLGSASGQNIHVRAGSPDTSSGETRFEPNGNVVVGGAITASGSLQVNGEAAMSRSLIVSQNIKNTNDNSFILMGKDSDLGFVKKSGAGSKLVFASGKTFTVAKSSATAISNPASETYTDVFKVDADGNQTVYGNAQVNRQLTVSSSATVSGIINANGGIIVPTTKYVQIADAPTQNNQATNKKYVDERNCLLLVYRGTEEAVDISDKTVDLNSLVIKRTDPGTRQLYKCVSSGGGGSKITNKPTSDGNFVLEVLSLRKVSDTDWSCRQTFTTKNNTTVGTYVRYAQNGSWTAWKEVVAGVQPINLGGTGATSAASARNNLGVGEGQTVKFGNLVTTDLTANGNARLVGRLNLGSTSATGVLRANESGAVVLGSASGQNIHIRAGSPDTSSGETRFEPNGNVLVGGVLTTSGSLQVNGEATMGRSLIVSQNIKNTNDNSFILMGKDSDLGFVKKSNSGAKLVFASGKSFTVAKSSATTIANPATETYTDVFKIDADGNQTVYGNAQVNRQLTVSSSATVNGIINANGGIIVPTTKYVQIADAPTQNNQATNKKYVDDKVASAISPEIVILAFQTFLPIILDIINGVPNLNFAPAAIIEDSPVTALAELPTLGPVTAMISPQRWGRSPITLFRFKFFNFCFKLFNRFD